MHEKDEQFVAVQNEKKVLATRLQKVQGKEATITADYSNREQPYSQPIIPANPLPSLSLDTQKKPYGNKRTKTTDLCCGIHFSVLTCLVIH